MGAASATPTNGRLAMVAFFIGGLAFLFLGSKDLFDAVAVSGSASMFLAPVLFFSVLGNRQVAPWAYVASFALAIATAVIYFTESSGYTSFMTALTGFEHKYTKLLILSALSLGLGSLAFLLGSRKNG